MYGSLVKKQSKLGQVLLGQVRLGQVRLGQVRLGQVRLVQVRLGQVRLGQVGQVRLGQVRLGQVRLGQVRLGQVRLGFYLSYMKKIEDLFFTVTKILSSARKFEQMHFFYQLLKNKKWYTYGILLSVEQLTLFVSSR